MLSLLRRAAQIIRHAPVLRGFAPVWSLLRRPYFFLLNRLGAASGLEITIAGVQIRLHPRFAAQNWEMIEKDSYEAYARELKPGDVVYDIGAHIGTYTLIALEKIGPRGRVVAYEPHDVTRRYLRTHLAWSGGADRVTVEDSACAAEIKKDLFYFRSGDDQAEGMNGLVPVEGFETKTTVVTTVDQDVLRLGLAPTLIKIDVEGGEWGVLRGAEGLLKEHHPRILLSLHPAALARQQTTPEAVLEWLKARGYQWKIIARDHEIHVLCRSASA